MNKNMEVKDVKRKKECLKVYMGGWVVYNCYISHIKYERFKEKMGEIMGKARKEKCEVFNERLEYEVTLVGFRKRRC